MGCSGKTRLSENAARVLVLGHNRVFGLIVYEKANPFFPEIMQVFETIAVQRGYEILSDLERPPRMETAVRRRIERGV